MTERQERLAKLRALKDTIGQSNTRRITAQYCAASQRARVNPGSMTTGELGAYIRFLEAGV